MDRERLDKWCERGIQGLILFILIFGPLATGAVRTLEFLIIQWATIGVVGLWLLRLWISPGHRLLWPPVCWAVILFVGYAIVRYQFADIEWTARGELIRVLVYACLFLVILNNLHRQESIQLISLALVLLAMGIALYAVYQFLTDSRYVWHFIKPDQYLKRGSGTYICPNHLAGFLEMVLPLSLAFLLAGRFRPVTKVFLGYGALAILAGIGVSNSRGGWLASGVSLLVFFAVLARKRAYRIPALVLLVVLIAVGIGFFLHTQRTQERFQRMFVPGQSDDSLARLWLWKPAWQIWQDNFWWGAGPGHFDARFRQYRPPPFQLSGQRVHNDYLNTLADWGLIGALLVAAAWVLLYLGVFRTWKFVQHSNDLATKPSNRSAFVLGAAIGLFAILLHSWVDFNMQIPANAILAVGLMAMLAGHLRFASDRYWVNPGWIGRILATLVGGIGMVYLGQQAISRGKEYVWLQRADHVKSPVEQVEDLRRAFVNEPMDFETSYMIGEVLRLLSWRGNDDYQDLARAALPWFKRGMGLNPYDNYNPLRYGMCLDWLGRHAEAEPYFRWAVSLDPKGYYTVASMGWHYFQVGDYPAAKTWFEHSFRLKPYSNAIATTYLRILQQRAPEPGPR